MINKLTYSLRDSVDWVEWWVVEWVEWVELDELG